jgi:decaprenyl-phosphate phosphoribosyltransferase
MRQDPVLTPKAIAENGEAAPDAIGPPQPSYEERPRIRTTVVGLVRGGRPKQWVKNLLVFAAPGAAGVLSRGSVIGRTGAAFASFCLVSSAMYLVNDVVDAPWDRAHPRNRYRPVAAGVVSPRLALAAAAFLVAGGAAIGGWLGWRFEASLGLYAGLTVAYSLWLREIAVLDIGVVASGFVIRAIAGSFAVHVPVSEWFLILTSFGCC